MQAQFVPLDFNQEGVAVLVPRNHKVLENLDHLILRSDVKLKMLPAVILELVKDPFCRFIFKTDHRLLGLENHLGDEHERDRKRVSHKQLLAVIVVKVPDHAVVEDDQRQRSLQLNETHDVPLASGERFWKLKMVTLQRICQTLKLLRQASFEDLVVIS